MTTPGRKSLSGGAGSTRARPLKIPDAEYDRQRLAAQALGVTWSAFARQALTEAADAALRSGDASVHDAETST